MLETQEIWKDVMGHEGYYAVSNLGRVKSLHRVIIKRNGTSAVIREKYLEPTIAGKNTPWPQAIITLSKDGKIKNVSYKSLLHKHFKKDYSIINQAAIYVPKEGEVFKPVDGYEGLYEVSNYGTVLSTPRRVSRRDGVSRRVGGKVLSHNGVHLCLCKYKDIQTHSFPPILMKAFYPEFDSNLYYVKKVSETGEALRDYQYFRRLEHNPISVTDKEGITRRFINYIECARAYHLSEDITLFLRFFFSNKHIHTKNAHLDGCTFAFDHPVRYKGELKIVSVVFVPELIRDRKARLKLAKVVKEPKPLRVKREKKVYQKLNGEGRRFENNKIKNQIMSFYTEEMKNKSKLSFTYKGITKSTTSIYTAYTIHKKGWEYIK